jgi:NAD(P)-dependent dehydrogenase (short-subunit alcohol dehydrogenase family)
MEHTVIIGGSRGIGFATAEQLLKAGQRATVTGLTVGSASRAAQRLGGTPPVSHLS